MIQTLYESEHEIYRQSLRKFLANEVEPNIEAWEAQRSTPRDIWLKFGEQGFLCPWVDEQYGGLGLGFEYAVIFAEEFGRARANAPMISLHSDIIVPYLATFGTHEQKSKWLPGCVSGEIITALAMTEPGTGSDLQAVRTTAVVEGDDYLINGAKTFISNGCSCDLVIVVCKTDPAARPAYKGMSLIVVEADAPGFKRGRKLNKMGNHSQDTSELFFDDCRVPRANLLGEEGGAFKALMQKLQQERIVAALQSQAYAEIIVEDAVEYCKDRKVFGKQVSEFQHNAFKIAEMATEVELGKVFLRQLCHDHCGKKNVVKQASMAKYWVCEMANRVAYDALQLYGGYGYMEEYPIARMYRDLRTHTIYAGTTEIMKTIIAREMGI